MVLVLVFLPKTLGNNFGNGVKNRLYAPPYDFWEPANSCSILSNDHIHMVSLHCVFAYARLDYLCDSWHNHIAGIQIALSTSKMAFEILIYWFNALFSYLIAISKMVVGHFVVQYPFHLFVDQNKSTPNILTGQLKNIIILIPFVSIEC